MKSSRKREIIRKRDGDKCYYCGLPMMQYGEHKATWLSRFGLEKGMHGTACFVRKSKETLEHLTRRADGGNNSLENLVLAHHVCNTLRDERTPEQHKEWIKGEFNNPLSPLYVIKNFEVKQ